MLQGLLQPKCPGCGQHQAQENCATSSRSKGEDGVQRTGRRGGQEVEKPGFCIGPVPGHRRELNRKHKPPTQVNYLSLLLVTRANQLLRYFLTHHSTCLKKMSDIGRVDVVLHVILQSVELRHSELPDLSPKYQLIL